MNLDKAGTQLKICAIETANRIAEAPGKIEIEVPEVKIPEVKMPELKVPEINVDTKGDAPEESAPTEAPQESQQ